MQPVTVTAVVVSQQQSLQAQSHYGCGALAVQGAGSDQSLLRHAIALSKESGLEQESSAGACWCSAWQSLLTCSRISQGLPWHLAMIPEEPGAAEGLFVHFAHVLPRRRFMSLSCPCAGRQIKEPLFLAWQKVYMSLKTGQSSPTQKRFISPRNWSCREACFSCIQG